MSSQIRQAWKKVKELRGNPDSFEAKLIDGYMSFRMENLVTNIETSSLESAFKRSSMFIIANAEIPAHTESASVVRGYMRGIMLELSNSTLR